MRKFNGWRSLIGGALLVGATISACQCYPDPELVVQPPKALPAAARKVSGVFIDAKSNKLVTAVLNVTVRDEAGQLATGIKDSAGNSASAFTVKNGIVSFSVDSSKALPIELTVVARGPGYSASSARVFFEKDGEFNFVQKMVSISNPPEGVESKQVSVGTTDSSGTTQAASTVQTDPEANTGGTTELTIPAQTTITAADGTPLTGALTATVSYFNNQDPTSLTAFPGGLDVQVPNTTGAGTSEGSFISGGFTAIEITDPAGNVASQFSQPISVKISVPATTVNPDTKQPVAVTDPVPFWSYNEATGQWAREGSVQLTAGAGGVLEATGQVNHLSYFNLDWFGDRCGTGRTIVVSGNPQGLFLTLRFTANGGGYVKEHPPFGSDPNNIETANVPQNTPMKIEAFYNGNKVGETTVTDMCSGGPIDLTVTMPNVTPATLAVHANQACEDDPTLKSPIPTATVIVEAKTGGGYPLVDSTNALGETSFSGLASGSSWTVTLIGPTFTLSKDVTLKGGVNDVNFDQTVTCQVVSGSTGGNR